MSESVLHVQYINRGFDVPLKRLGLRPVELDGGVIKQALAKHLSVPLSWLNGFELNRDHDGDVTLRLVAFE